MARGVRMTTSKTSEETTRRTCFNMQLTENKQKSKRRGEKEDLCCAWESSDSDTGINDDTAFPRHQKLRHKCTYLDEKNIILAPHLLAQPRLCVSAANDANPTRKASQITRVPAKSAIPDININSDRPSASGPNGEPIHPISSDSMTQRQANITENSMQVHIVEVNGNLPMIEWFPDSSHEENKVWRCAEFISAKHERKSPEKTSGQTPLSKVVHLGSSSPASGLPTVGRQRVVIRRAARGYRRIQVKASHGERKHSTWVNHKDVHYSYYSLSAPQNRYQCLCSPFQPQMRYSPEGELQDGIDRKQQGQLREFAEENKDILCQSGLPKIIKSPPTPRHVTFSHILQALQSKAANFPEFRGQKGHKAV